MWSDNEAVIDLLNVQHLVGAVLRVVKDERLDPVTVGVYGDWGSGKSSVIRLLREEIADEPDLLCVYFNGWRFEGYEDAKAALATTILEEIRREAEKPAGGKLEKVKTTVTDAITRFGKRVDKLRLGRRILGAGVNASVAGAGLALAAGTVGAPITAAALGAVALASLIGDAKKLDGEAIAEILVKEKEAEAAAQRDVHDSIRDFHDEFAKLVETLDITRLVVVVDDLDRCLPSNVIETLEAIRLFLAAPKTAFVIAADEALIREAVTQRFPDHAGAADGEDGTRHRAAVGARYLEKLIQVPVRVPPLSRSDLHGYLNLLFADQRLADAAAFKELCTRVRDDASYDAISFHAENAERLLGTPVTEDLKSDFVIAEQIAPVLALCAEGNPRQTKRFLNALVLRIDMAADRHVVLDRAIAAKLLLLEYFLPDLFRTLALAAAGNDGLSTELAALESEVRRERGEAAAPGGDEPAPTGTFTAVAGAMNATDRFRTWLRTEPFLGETDLRPYIYFASERYALPIGLAQRLSPEGASVLRDFMRDSETAHTAAADRAITLPTPEIMAIIAELSAKARQGRDLDERHSPLAALAKLAGRRPAVGPDVIAAFLAVPFETLPPGAAVQIFALGRDHASLTGVAVDALRALSRQKRNDALKTAASRRLETLTDGAGGTSRPAPRRS
jgi:hypothetical protein